MKDDLLTHTDEQCAWEEVGHWKECIDTSLTPFVSKMENSSIFHFQMPMFLRTYDVESNFLKGGPSPSIHPVDLFHC